jgi:hypothetical protein
MNRSITKRKEPENRRQRQERSAKEKEPKGQTRRLQNQKETGKTSERNFFRKVKITTTSVRIYHRRFTKGGPISHPTKY